MKSKKGGRIIINLSTPEIKNLPESIQKDGKEISKDTLTQTLLGPIIKPPSTNISYETHIVLFNKHIQRDWGYLTFYLERKDDMYYLPHISTITIDENSSDKIEEIVKERLTQEYPSIDNDQVEQIFQNGEELFVFVNDKGLNSITSENQRLFISNELKEPYINESCRNLMKFEDNIYNAINSKNVTFYSSANAYICEAKDNQYKNINKSQGSVINEAHPFVEHDIIGKTYIFSLEPLNRDENVRKYVYPINYPEKHLLDEINKETYDTLKNSSFITFNQGNSKMVSLKSRNLFIEV